MRPNEFRAWCDAQEPVILYPKAGDCVLFYSHIPHQGAKFQENLERSNVVCHYQCTPMYEGIWHVSRPIGYQGTFPLAGDRVDSSQPGAWRPSSRSYAASVVSSQRTKRTKPDLRVPLR